MATDTFGRTLLYFSCRVLTALCWKGKKKNLHKDKHPIDPKDTELPKMKKHYYRYLLSTDNKRFTSSIETLEASLYGNGKINFNKVKQEAEEQI